MLLSSQKVPEVCQFMYCRSSGRSIQGRSMVNLSNSWENYSNRVRLNETILWNCWIYVKMFWGDPHRLPPVWILWRVRIIMPRQLHLRVVNSSGLNEWVLWRFQCTKGKEYEAVQGLVRLCCACSFEFKNTK